MGLRRCQQAQTKRWLQESIDLFDCTTSRLFDTGNTPGVSPVQSPELSVLTQDNAFTFTKCLVALSGLSLMKGGTKPETSHTKLCSKCECECNLFTWVLYFGYFANKRYSPP